MSTSPVPAWLAGLAKADTGFVENVINVRAGIFQSGQLNLKTKLIIAMVIDAYSNHQDGARHFAEEARKQGATNEELAEAVEVLYYLGGAQALHNCQGVFAT